MLCRGWRFRLLKSSSESDLPEAAPERASEPQQRTARDRMLSRMRAGIPLGGPPYPRREEIYNRVAPSQTGDGE